VANDEAGTARADLLTWAAATAAGLALTLLAVRFDARLGTAAPPFLGHYELRLTPLGLLAPAVAAAALVAYAPGRLDRLRAPALVGYLVGLAWTLSLAVAGGTDGLTRFLAGQNGLFSDAASIGGRPLAYLAHFTGGPRPPAVLGHPPGPVLVLWALDRAGVTGTVAVALVLTVLGALLVPAVYAAVCGVCGEPAARRYLPVVTLAPYGLWLAGSMDAVVAALAAAMLLAGIHASARERHGVAAAGWALLCGALLGVAALFSYSVAWLGLSVACLYFARRRPFLNVATGLGALLPVLAAKAAGFDWLAGLAGAHADFTSRIVPQRAGVWWSLVSLVALLLAAGPPLAASARKSRNTPGWPFLVGAACAVLFSILAGLARGGVEHAWLAFFPWLTVAAVAPQRQGGPPVPAGAPWLLAAAGAAVAVLLAAVLDPNL
jgi:hypothetical protein